ncbi:MAG: acetyl-CoA carboxylase biotin carboxyl carrier protein subunit [Lachnospiraceae bacterium]|nr:acetyl-CoA carboxylase biotin carboxyl carrier protein subunit [Lachnospiraceae bacterium]
MKSYTITVNGNVYDVTVEENGAGAAPAAAAPVRAAAPTPAPAAAPAPAAGGAGSVKIEAGAAGKVFSIDKKAGDAVKRGDTILVLEVMKMETPVVAPEDGTVASIEVSAGQAVEAGALLATMNN